jgi:NhaP-type Na+/H+ and K+/H+ antiporter
LKDSDPAAWTIVVISFVSSLFFFIVFGLLDETSPLSLIAFVLAAVSLVLALTILARLTVFSADNRKERKKKSRRSGKRRSSVGDQ